MLLIHKKHLFWWVLWYCRVSVKPLFLQFEGLDILLQHEELVHQFSAIASDWCTTSIELIFNSNSGLRAFKFWKIVGSLCLLESGREACCRLAVPVSQMHHWSNINYKYRTHSSSLTSLYTTYWGVRDFCKSLEDYDGQAV